MKLSSYDYYSIEFYDSSNQPAYQSNPFTLPVSYTTTQETNIALNKTATSSSVESSGLPPEDTFDGSLHTRWASASNDPEWLQVDLESFYDISKVILDWEGSYGEAYEIQVSNNASNWTTIYSTTNGSGGRDTLNISGTGRYIRMYGTERGTVNGYSLWEMSVYGEPTAPPVKIIASPSGGTKTVGAPFSINVAVESNDGAFNAARASVSTSSNLTINSISAPTSNACNMQYTQTPTTSSPSFAGAIYGSSSTNCNVYTMVVTPNDTGTGTVTFTDGSVKSYEDNSEIMTGVTNASFTLSDGPTPTPTAMLEFSVTSPYETYKENFTITGTKLTSITAMYLNGSDDDSEYPTSTSWEIPVTLSLGDNNFTLYGSDGTNQTATQNLVVDRHTLGDINGDGEIDLVDASLFAVDWDKTEDLTYVLSDMNDDGVVDLTDLSILAKLQE